MKKNEVEKVEENKKEKKTRKTKKLKTKKNIMDRVLIILIGLVVLEVLMIPGFIYAGMNQIFPIIMFLVLPTSLAIFILLLSRNTLKESRKKKQSVTKKKEAEA